MNKKILLISFRLGYESLLYWDAILSNIKAKYINFRVFTANKEQVTNDKSVKTEQKLTGLKYYHNKNKINQSLLFIPFPFFIIDIIKYKPNVIILNEFNLACFYTVLFKMFYSNTKILLLVESDPNIGNNKPIKKNIKYFTRKYITNRVDKIVTNNTLGEKYLIEILGSQPSKIKTAPYLTSTPKKTSKYIKTNNSLINFLYVGQLVDRKGIIYFLKALDSLEQNIKNRIVVKIVGDGVLMSFLNNYIEKNNLNFIELTGKIPFEELNHYYQQADCFVLPTLHDYRALVGFEALHFGCAIIDSIYDGARFEVVEEGINGYIIDPKNSKEFTKAILNIVINNELRESFCKKSLQKSSSFSQEKCDKNLIDTLQSIIKQN